MAADLGADMADTAHGTSPGLDPRLGASEHTATSAAEDYIDSPVFTVSGAGDWDDLVDEATSLHEERIVVNMGPQHPSTHGVLRLILELDGETVTETRAGIGYLHTGIEKNMEFRTWVQGVTFCTRMDYLTPMFQETAYCLAIEKLLGITDDIPERASVIRVLMMELTRISSHLVCIGTGGMEMGATTVMTIGFRERERVFQIIEMITGLRMNNAYIRPGGVAQDLPPGAIDKIRELVPEIRKGIRELELLVNENPIVKGRMVGVGHLDLAGCMASGHHRPGAAFGGPAARPAQGRSLLRLRDLRLRRHHPRHRRRLRPAADPPRRDVRVAADREQCTDRLEASAGDPVMVADKKIAWPAQLAIGTDGMGNSLDHIRTIMGVDGRPHPPLQARHRGLPGAARSGLCRGRERQGRARLPPGVRRRDPPLPRALPRSLLQQPASDLDHVRRRPGRRRHRRGRVHRPRHGRC
jgi:NADH-quinone oxidoreductase subunit D